MNKTYIILFRKVIINHSFHYIENLMLIENYNKKKDNNANLTPLKKIKDKTQMQS